MSYDKDYIGVGEGWRSLVMPLIERCEAEGAHVEQIKEKFGGLRFYVAGDCSDDLYAAIDKAECDSFGICEECGAPGELTVINGWMHTSCGTHSA